MKKRLIPSVAASCVRLASLAFVILCTLPACQEETVIEESFATTKDTQGAYTFIYEDKKYVGASVNDIPPLVAKISSLQSGNTHLAVYVDDKSKNTFHIYDSEEELRSKHTSKKSGQSARENNDGCFMQGRITMFHDKYFKNFGAGYSGQKDRVIIRYDENSISPLFNRPYAEVRHFNSVKNDGGQTINFDNKLSSLVIGVTRGYSCARDALIFVTLYDLPYHSLNGGATLSIVARSSPDFIGGSTSINDLSIFKISNNTFPLSSGDWDNKASSLRSFLRYD